jgi:protein tyrosine phosphatase (PTP) superfamily phosphohydrolase (DUF442 family)
MSVTRVDGSGTSTDAVASHNAGGSSLGAIGKTAWRRSKSVMKSGRRAIVERSPCWLNRMLGPCIKYLDMLLLDHGVFRVLYLNKHRVGENVWRSAQPAPHHIRALARQGVRTIVNLRGERMCGSFWLERDICARYGIALVNFQIRSRMPPSVEQVEAAHALFAQIEYPMLMHCKSGADRVGLMSALYRHIRQADTGVLNRFFEQYLEDNRQRHTPFLEWVRHVYDPAEMKRSFRAAGWARRFVDGVLRRE